jgi:uncharacterized protein (TIGR04222 family)
VTPSKVVDEVWHLHLIYTQSYWGEFCPHVLGRPLHHDPGQGRRGEAQRHAQQYADTLASYRRIFGCDPPAEIWPSRRRAFGRRASGRRAALLSALPAPLALLPLAIGWTNPFDLRGPDFLLLFACSFVAALVLAGLLRYWLRAPGDEPRDDSELTTYEKAYLSGGWRRAVEAAVVRLSDQRLIDVGRKKLSLSAVWPRPALVDPEPVEERVYAAAEQEVDVTQVWGHARRGAGPLRQRLESLGLVLDGVQRELARWLPLLLALSVPAAGAYKIYVGLSRGRPVGFLVVACLASAGLALVLFGRSPLRSRRGDAALRRLRKEHAEQPQGATAEATPSLVDAVALLGLGAVAGTALSPLQTYLGAPPTERRSWGSSGDGGSACSSTCGSSGCGGGGCGGGGCGGCGGGGCGGCGGCGGGG